MIIPYSTDAPVYYFPWATIGLIVTNIITFVLTLGGEYRWGWLLTYGNGLHPLEWVAWNFLHFGVIHLLGNMFFLWAFGIVVEGKLGWWKFLLVYLGIGTVAGFLIQVFMLGHDKEMIAANAPSTRTTAGLNSVERARSPIQHGGVDDLDDDAMPMQLLEKMRAGGEDAEELDDERAAKQNEDLRFGAGGASAAIYGLMAIVLLWAPRNEVHCLWLFGMRGGAVEIEYLYFCGIYIFMEVVVAFYHSSQYEATSEVLHSSGAIVGAGVGWLLLRKNWVDCENWDLFSIMEGKHSSTATVGDWQTYYAASAGHRDAPISGLTESRGVDVVQKKKKKAKPRLVELSDDGNEIAEPPRRAKPQKPNPAEGTAKIVKDRAPKSIVQDESAIELEWIDEGEESPAGAASRKGNLRRAEVSLDELRQRIRKAIRDGKFTAAFAAYQERKSIEDGSTLLQEELRQLASGLFRTRATKEASITLTEYITRYPEVADRERVKLAVLNANHLDRPMAALKLLAQVNPTSLADDFQEVYRKTARHAQRLVSEGVVDA